MKGAQPEGKCPVCQGRFVFNSQKTVYECENHPGVYPTRYSWQRYVDRQRVRRGTDLNGKSIRTLAQISELNGQLDKEITGGHFSIAKWKSRKGIDFNCNPYLFKWLTENEGLAPSTFRTYKTYYKYYMLPFLGDKDVRKVVSLKPFYRALPGLAPLSKGLSEKFKKNVCDAAYTFFSWVKEHLWEEYQEVIQLPTRPDIRLNEYEPETISREVRLMFIKIVDPEHRPIFTFYLLQGCRPSEARALKYDCINADSVCYRRTFSDNELMERTKGKNTRWNYIYPEVQAVIGKGFPDQFVFTYKGAPYSSKVLNSLYRKYQAKFNEKYKTNLKLPFYEAGKHSFGTEMVNDGISMDLLQKWFGHSSPKMTERYSKMNVVDAFKRHNVTALNNRKRNSGSGK